RGTTKRRPAGKPTAVPRNGKRRLGPRTQPRRQKPGGRLATYNLHKARTSTKPRHHQATRRSSLHVKRSAADTQSTHPYKAARVGGRRRGQVAARYGTHGNPDYHPYLMRGRPVQADARSQRDKLGDCTNGADSPKVLKLCSHFMPYHSLTQPVLPS
ncbi:Hypothetical predicted protein, partial [Pelobates cultripes]